MNPRKLTGGLSTHFARPSSEKSCPLAFCAHCIVQVDNERLEEIGRLMFPTGDWKTQMAEHLEVDFTTIWRWLEKKRVPNAVAAGLECMAKEHEK